MSIIDDYGNPNISGGPKRGSDPAGTPPTGERKRGLQPSIEPWAGGAIAAAGRDQQAYEPWAGSGMKPAPASTSQAPTGMAPGMRVVEGNTNPANLNAPGTRRNPDDRGFK